MRMNDGDDLNARSIEAIEYELVVHENYLVFYRVDAARVEIVAVIHAHQSWL